MRNNGSRSSHVGHAQPGGLHGPSWPLQQRQVRRPHHPSRPVRGVRRRPTRQGRSRRPVVSSDRALPIRGHDTLTRGSGRSSWPAMPVAGASRSSGAPRSGLCPVPTGQSTGQASPLTGVVRAGFPAGWPRSGFRCAGSPSWSPGSCAPLLPGSRGDWRPAPGNGSRRRGAVREAGP